MTIKTIKTVLFASLIAALILPFSAMTMVDAAPNADKTTQQTIEKSIFLDAVVDIHKMRSDKLNLELEKIHDSPELDKAKNDLAIKSLETKISEKMEILDAYEAQRKAFYYIEPTREQYILSIVEEMRAEVKEFGKSVDMHSYGVNIDYKDKGIIVATSDTAYDSQIQQIIDKYPTDVNVKLVHGMASDESCSSRTADCDPIVGGIQTQSQGASGNGYCTLGLPAKQGSTYGFITAGHCINDNEEFHQPNEFFSFNEIGDSADSWYVSDCDCAWVEKTTGTLSKSWVLRDPNVYLSITSEASSRPTTGTQVVLFGVASDFQQGEVINPNSQYTYNSVDWDLVETDYTSTSGDSGGTVTNAAGSQILGVHKGKNINNNNPVFTPWSVIDTKFGLTLHP